YDLGVRTFALFFDDIDGIGTDPARQAKLVNDLTDDFVVRNGDVTNLMICPTDYSQLWAKPGPEGPLAIYGRDLNPKAEVFWTGAVVCSDLTRETLDFVNSRIKRPALFWWNYPVSDYCRNIILQGPVYGLDPTLTSAEVAGIESNPMEHGEASKLALYGVADYTWNQAAYNPIDNWERGLRYMTPEAADAYRTFAIHNCDTETGYRRDESWETETFHYNDYTQEQFDALRAEFERVAAAPSQLRAKAGNNLLLGELAPWLTEFEKLGQRGLRTLDLIKTYESGNDSLFWCNYVANIMTPQQRAEYQAHKTGTMKLHPFYENAMDHMPADFFGKLTGEKANVHRAIGSYPNLPTTLQKLMLDGDTATYYTSAQSQSEGDWIGIDAGKVINVEEITILQGRNSVDDVDYFDHAILEASADGQTWTALSEPLVKTYEIRYSGEPVQARYVRLRRLPSEKKNWTSVRVFEVNPPSAQRIGMDITDADSQTALSAFDSNPASTYVNNGVLSFTPRKDAKEMIMLLADIKTAVIVTQLDKAGHVLTSSAITTP
ncbi:MAG: beta-N-acetylglucosaminidase domain-containing protein, partial [Muribaculaceae bacterium]|nr:beta-N-acetylglucosaminidase domain-containing protein [Muribaculaceae bacterium]